MENTHGQLVVRGLKPQKDLSLDTRGKTLLLVRDIRETYTSTLNKIFYYKPQFRLFPSFIFFKITTHLHLDVNFENVGNFLFIHQQELLNFDSNETFNPSIILKRQKKKKSGTINNNTDPHINYNTRLTPSPSLCRLTTDNGQDSRFHRASPSNSPSVSRACNSSSILVGVEWRKSGSNMEHRYMELESIVEKLSFHMFSYLSVVHPGIHHIRNNAIREKAR